MKKISGRNGTEVSYSDININIEKAIRDVLVDNKSAYVAEVKNKTPVRSGALKKAITSELTESSAGTTLTIYAGKRWYIAHFVEFGTIRMAPEPFMRPAYTTIKKDYRKKIIQIDINKYLIQK